MLNKSQQGMSFWGILVVVPMVGFFILMGLKLIPIYMEDGAISTALNTMSREPEGYPSAMDVRGSFAKRIEVNNVKVVSIDDMKIEREGPFFRINLDYEVDFPVVSNISMVVSFSHSVQVPAL